MANDELTLAERRYLTDLENIPTSVRSRLIGWAFELVPSIGLFSYGLYADRRLLVVLGFLGLLYFSVWRMYSQFRGFRMLIRFHEKGVVEAKFARMRTTMTAINLNEKLATFSERWSPKIVSDFNEHDVMVMKVKGEFNWHSHPDTDDFFLVLKGRITIKLRDQDVHLNEGEMFVVPKGVEHCPVAEDEAEVLLIEPRGTPNTGDQATATKKMEI